MEISNRSLAIIGVTVVVVVAAMRINSERAKVDAVPEVAPVTTTVAQDDRPATITHFRPIPNSPLPDGGTDFQANADSPAPAATTQAQDQDQAQPDAAPTDQTTTDTTQTDPNATQDLAVDVPTSPDVTINMRGRYPSGLPGDLTDQEVFDRMMGLVDPEDQPGLAGMWLTMSDDERRELLESMRIAYGGY